MKESSTKLDDLNGGIVRAILTDKVETIDGDTYHGDVVIELEDQRHLHIKPDAVPDGSWGELKMITQIYYTKPFKDDKGTSETVG